MSGPWQTRHTVEWLATRLLSSDEPLSRREAFAAAKLLEGWARYELECAAVDDDGPEVTAKRRASGELNGNELGAAAYQAIAAFLRHPHNHAGGKS